MQKTWYSATPRASLVTTPSCTTLHFLSNSSECSTGHMQGPYCCYLSRWHPLEDNSFKTVTFLPVGKYLTGINSIKWTGLLLSQGQTQVKPWNTEQWHRFLVIYAISITRELDGCPHLCISFVAWVPHTAERSQEVPSGRKRGVWDGAMSKSSKSVEAAAGGTSKGSRPKVGCRTGVWRWPHLGRI